MASFLVSPGGATDWRLQPDELADRLRRRWPEATVEPGSSDRILVWFHVTAAGEPVDAYLAADGHTVWVEGGSLEQAAEVAAWYREQAPAELEVEFADEGYEGEVTVTPGMSGAVIAERYGSGFE